MDDVSTDVPWSTASQLPWTATVTEAFLTTVAPATVTVTREVMTTVAPVITTAQQCTGSGIPYPWGFITAVIAILSFATYPVPVKKFETGDGMFFQWIMSAAILIVGLVVQVLRKSPVFLPIIMVGGMIRVTGNVCVVPIVKCIGLGLGVGLWCLSALFSGWATGRFGLFGARKEIPDNVAMNYIGVALAVISMTIFALIKVEPNMSRVDTTTTVEQEERTPPSIQRYQRLHSDSLYSLNSNSHDVIVFDNRRRTSSGQRNTEKDARGSKVETRTSFVDTLSPTSKRIVGVGLSVFSGLLYGQVFTPTFTAMHEHPEYSQNALDYVFATFCGIFLTSTVYFLLYAAVMKNRPRVYPRAILPGAMSGVVWGVGQTCWFVANDVLSEAVAFPIVASGPAVVASLVGVFVFKEIKGRRNILLLLLGFAVTVTSAALAGLSRKATHSGC